MKPQTYFFAYEAPEDRGAGTPPADDPTPTPDPPVYSGPSQEEWMATQEQIKQLTGIVPTVQQMAQIFEQANREDPDPADFDIDDYIQQQVEARLAPIMPVVTTAAQRSGEERMKNIFAEQKKEIGDFDEKLAERAAHSFFSELGDAQAAVIEGAKYAAEIRKAERAAGQDEYKASLKRGPHNQDPDVAGGGDRSVPPAKSYDEVVERWAGTTEV